MADTSNFDDFEELEHEKKRKTLVSLYVCPLTVPTQDMMKKVKVTPKTGFFRTSLSNVLKVLLKEVLLEFRAKT